jgi:hypothetical protein
LESAHILGNLLIIFHLLETLMHPRQLLASVTAALIFLPVIVRADIPPPRDLVLRELADAIKKAGYECPGVNNAVPAAAPLGDDMVWGDVRPQLVTCDNGKKFLVAQSPRSRPWLPPPPPPPAITVKPI